MVKTELEEAGLDAENMAETTAQLQAKLMALTNGKVNVMIDEDNFNSTYDLLKQIAEVWDDLTDVERAGALELIGGKRQANVLASLISNFETAEGAVKSSLNSQGSALEENTKWMDSIEGKTQKLTNTMQNLWNNSIKSDGVKAALDIANHFAEIASQIGLIKTLIIGAVGALAAFKKNSSFKIAGFDNNIEAITKAAKENGWRAGAKEIYEQMHFNIDFKKVSAGLKGYVGEIQKAYKSTSGFSKITKPLGTAMGGIAKGASAAASSTKTMGAAAKVAAAGVSIFNSVISMGIGLLVSYAITAVLDQIDQAIHHFEYLKEEVNDLEDTYNEAKSAHDETMKSLTEPLEGGQYKTLNDEFKALAKSVDSNGNNISLTADEYARYREICETICNINPNLIAGYDSATEAIGNNVNALENLIAAEERKMRIEAREYVSTTNMKKYAEDAIHDYNEANKLAIQPEAQLRRAFLTHMGDELFGDGYGFLGKKNGKEAVEEFLKNSGLSNEEIEASIKDYLEDNGDFNVTGWLTENTKFVADHLNGYSDELEMAAINYNDALNRISEAEDALIDKYLATPDAFDSYQNLSKNQQSFITEWIKNSDMFKIDENTTEAEVLELQSTIRTFISGIVNNNYAAELDNGETITAGQIIDSIVELDDLSGISWKGYTDKINEYINLLWDAIGAESNKFGFTDKNALKIALGIEFETENENLMYQQYAKIKGISEDEAKKYFNNLPATKVQMLIQRDWNMVDDEASLAKIMEDIKGQKEPALTYSAISTGVDTFNSILTQTREIVSGNTIVTKEYKDALYDLIKDTDKVDECFSASNEMIVENAMALQELVEQSASNVESNILLAKSQARLQYQDLVSKLREAAADMSKLSDSNDQLTATSINQANALMDQIDAVQQMIYKYQLLETQLYAADGAFRKFNEAKEVDALNTTGDSVTEMAQTMYDAFTKTGHYGTEAFKAAVEGLVPDSVYKNLKTDAEQLAAIKKYYNDNIFPMFTESNETLSLEYGDTKEWANKGIEKGVFEGTWADGLKIADGMQLKEAAKLMGMTEASLIGMLAELDKHDFNMSGESFLSQIGITNDMDAFESDVADITSEMQKLTEEKIGLLIEEDGAEKNKERINEINKELKGLDKNMVSAQKNAAKMFSTYSDGQTLLDSLDEVENKTASVQGLIDEGYITEEQQLEFGITGEDTVQDAMDKILAKQLEIGEPTELTIELAQQGIQNQVDDLLEDLTENGITIPVEYDKTTGEYNLGDNQYIERNVETGEFEIKSSSGQQDNETLQQLVSNLNSMDKLTNFAETGMVTTETYLSNISEALNAICKVVTKEDPPNQQPTGDDSTTNDGNTGSEGSNSGSDTSGSANGKDSGSNDNNKSGGSKELPTEIAWHTNDVVKKYEKQVNKEKQQKEKGWSLPPEYERDSFEIFDNYRKEMSGWLQGKGYFKDSNSRNQLANEAANYQLGRNGSFDKLIGEIKTSKNAQGVISDLYKMGTFNPLLKTKEVNNLGYDERHAISNALSTGKGDAIELTNALDGIDNEKIKSQIQQLLISALGEDFDWDVKPDEKDGSAPNKSAVRHRNKMDYQIDTEGVESELSKIEGITEKEDYQITIDAITKYNETGNIEDLINGLRQIEDEDFQATVIATLVKQGSFDETFGDISELTEEDKTVLVSAMVKGEGDVEEINNVLGKIEDETVKAQITADIQKAMPKLEVVDGKLQEINDSNPTPTADLNDNASKGLYWLQGLLGDTSQLTATPTTNLNDNATAPIAGVQSDLWTLNATTASPTVSVSTGTAKAAIQGLIDKIREYKSEKEGTSGANGNAHVGGNAFSTGTAFKGGKWGAKKTETALTGELGPELVN